MKKHGIISQLAKYKTPYWQNTNMDNMIRNPQFQTISVSVLNVRKSFNFKKVVIITNLWNSMLHSKEQNRLESFVYNGFQTFLDITDTVLDNSRHAFNFYWFLVVPNTHTKA